MGQFKLKFEIDEIEFEAEGEYEEVARERRIFVEEILPLVAKLNGCNCGCNCGEKCDCGCNCECDKEDEEVVEEVKALKNEKIHAIEDNLIVPPTIVEEKKQPCKSNNKKKNNKK